MRALGLLLPLALLGALVWTIYQGIATPSVMRLPTQRDIMDGAVQYVEDEIDRRIGEHPAVRMVRDIDALARDALATNDQITASALQVNRNIRNRLGETVRLWDPAALGAAAEAKSNEIEKQVGEGVHEASDRWDSVAKTVTDGADSAGKQVQDYASSAAQGWDATARTVEYTASVAEDEVQKSVDNAAQSWESARDQLEHAATEAHQLAERRTAEAEERLLKEVTPELRPVGAALQQARSAFGDAVSALPLR